MIKEIMAEAAKKKAEQTLESMETSERNVTVKDLREFLAKMPDDMEVILQKDAEGNGYSPLSGADPNAVYIPDSTYSGEVYNMGWSASDACMTDDEWEEIKSKPRALILHPIN